MIKVSNRSVARLTAAGLSLAFCSLQFAGAIPTVSADGANEEFSDVAVPTPDIPASPYRVERIATGATPGIGDPMTVTAPLEAQGTYDSQATTGTVQDVCFAFGRTYDDIVNARPLPGVRAAYDYVDKTFSWVTAGTMGNCRERFSGGPGCDGQAYPTNVGPTFYSTCWSNHAAGRAFDVMVGGDARYDSNVLGRGTSLVNWLLAPDGTGRQQVRARRLGIQQILFNDHCWSSDTTGDRTVTSYAQMRTCSVGHENHVHVDFTIVGAKGLTSAYGTPPAVAPTPLAAFQANTGVLYSVDPSYAPTNRGFGMMPGTTPAMAVTSTGYVIAFQANTGVLHTITQDGVLMNRGLGMKAGTSPTVVATASGYVVAFQANTGVLWTMTETGAAMNRGFGMRAGTSPSIAASGTGYVVAFQANTGVLWTMTQAGAGSNRGFGMRAGTSPSAAAVGSSYAVAFQANTGILWTMDSNGVGSNRAFGMRAGTSPALAAVGAGYVVAFQANTGVLWTMTQAGAGSNRGLSVMTGTSPSIKKTTTGYLVAFQAPTTLLWTMTDTGVASNLGFGMGTGTSPTL